MDTENNILNFGSRAGSNVMHEEVAEWNWQQIHRVRRQIANCTDHQIYTYSPNNEPMASLPVGEMRKLLAAREKVLKGSGGTTARSVDVVRLPVATAEKFDSLVVTGSLSKGSSAEKAPVEGVPVFDGIPVDSDSVIGTGLITVPFVGPELNRRTRSRVLVFGSLAASLTLVLILTMVCYKMVFDRESEDGTTAATEKMLTLYQRLDMAIDDYLAERADLSPAQTIAQEMCEKTGDRIGIDLVDSYSRVSKSDFPALVRARQLMQQVESNPPGSDYSHALRLLHEAQTQFSHFGITTEVNRTTVRKIYYLAKTVQYIEFDELISQMLPMVSNRSHLSHLSQLLCYQGEVYVSTNRYFEAIPILEESLNLALHLNSPQLSLGPAVILAAMYWNINDNARAFSIATAHLGTARELNHRHAIQLLQVAGMSAFSLGYRDIARAHLAEATQRCETLGIPVYLSITKAFAGVVAAETGELSVAKNYIDSSLQTVSQITDMYEQLRIQSLVVGYQARINALSGNNFEAIRCYQRAIQIMETIRFQESLLRAQLHQGLGEVYLWTGDNNQAISQLQIAAKLSREARKNSNSINDLVTFAITHRSIEGIAQFFKNSSPK
ncbi:MAG: tetratricopeptide repeat protein [Acidobacteriota bacterium]